MPNLTQIVKIRHDTKHLDSLRARRKVGMNKSCRLKEADNGLGHMEIDEGTALRADR